MARQNLFSTLNEISINYSEEMRKIEDLFTANIILYSSLESMANSNIKKWKHRGTCLSLQEIREKLGVTSNDLYKNDIDTMLIYFELILNMIPLGKKGIYEGEKDYLRRQATLIEENIHSILQKLNYKIMTRNRTDFIIVENDINTTAVAEAYEDISIDVIEYKKPLTKGNINLKSKILHSLAKEYEGIITILKSNNYISIVSDLNSLLNNLHIRHNNEKGHNANDVIKKLDKKELEKLYDKTYDLLLTALLINKYLDYKPEIKKLNKQLKELKNSNKEENMENEA